MMLAVKQSLYEKLHSHMRIEEEEYPGDGLDFACSLKVYDGKEVRELRQEGFITNISVNKLSSIENISTEKALNELKFRFKRDLFYKAIELGKHEEYATRGINGQATAVVFTGSVIIQK